MTHDEFHPDGQPALLTNVPDLAENVIKACSLYAIVTVAQAGQFFERLDAWSETRTKLGITEADLEIAREAIRPYRQAMECPSRDYATIPCGIPLERPNPAAFRETPITDIHDRQASGDDGGNDDA